MLKIKDSVDLKELQKFGFEYYKGRPHTYYQWGYEKYDISLLIYDEIGNRNINILTPYDYNLEDSEGHVDILFDLIRAGLVEKVVEDND